MAIEETQKLATYSSSSILEWMPGIISYCEKKVAWDNAETVWIIKLIDYRPGPRQDWIAGIFLKNRGYKIVLCITDTYPMKGKLQSNMTISELRLSPDRFSISWILKPHNVQRLSAWRRHNARQLQDMEVIVELYLKKQRINKQ